MIKIEIFQYFYCNITIFPFFLKAMSKIKYKKASIYPAMSRDIAFFGSNDQEEVAEFVKAQVEKYPLIENHFCFDVFTKEDKTCFALQLNWK